VGEHCVDTLGRGFVIDHDQCWVRRQYPPAVAPPRHHPHTWHQDGALGFDFMAATGEDDLLRMVTCWIALTPCGVDAPGLELVTDRIDHLVWPRQLADAAVAQLWPMERRVCPVLDAGDALIFDGSVLHRTHVSAAMSRTRTSIELRCFPGATTPRAKLRRCSTS
jgi:ectoine hydroxylase-related dioxygenase (phytanoyl-CoA dioxygenase family)